MRLRLLPEGVTPVARTLLIGRGLRAFADGFVSLLLPAYLTALGFSPLEVGVLATATLLGSAALTLWIGTAAHRFGRLFEALSCRVIEPAVIWTTNAIALHAPVIERDTAMGTAQLHERRPAAFSAI